MEKSMSENVTSRPWQSYNTVYTTAKAGMEGVDKEKVQRIVYEMSKGSKYFENEERKEAYTKKKIYSMQVQLGKLTDTDILQHKKFAENRIVELEATRDLSKIWLHVDMDAFYAAVETLANPSLEGKPMAVGSMSMISTANYEARKFGVRAAMPGFIAKKLCPQLIFAPVDFNKYTHFSDLTRKVFQKYDPNFVAASLDEAYLDITSFCYDKGMTGGEVAEELRASICKETGLTCSAGVAPNRLLAKVCSDINKPNGQYVLPNERMAVMTFISSLPVRKIGGIGKVTESILKGCFGITTCEEMLQKSSLLCALFSRTSADFFLSVALGLGGTNTPQVSQRKGMSTERTFSPTEDESLLQQKLVDLSENLSADMKKEGLCGRTLTLKLKTSCFEIRTWAVTLSNYIFSGEDILRHATKLLKAELPVSLRLMGLRMSQFGEGRNGATLDSKQRTLSNFIVTEDVSASEPGDLDLSHSSFREDNFAVREGASSSIDTQGPSESTELPQVPGLPETGGHSDLTIGDYEANVDDHDKVGTARTSFPAEATQFTESNTSSMLFSQGSSAVREPQSSSTLKEPLVWLNDYQCSICLIELPPTFAEERREHFDFHLAERLQNEEWEGTFSRIPTPKHRLLKHDQMSQSRQKKKQKASRAEGKHIPIHTFFAKTSQNF